MRVTTRRDQSALRAGLSFGPGALCMTLSCGAVTAPAVEPSNERQWAGEFEDCSKWADLCWRLFHSCRRLSFSKDGTFRLAVNLRDYSTVHVGAWREGSDGCIQLDPRLPDPAPAGLTPAPAVAQDASHSEAPEGGGLEELCAIDPDACISLPLDVASGWAQTICRAPEGLLMQFSNGRSAELTPARKRNGAARKP